jgi:AcrR family transcriptional regulator
MIARKIITNTERTERTRDAILSAAKFEFVANGLKGARMEAIAKASGINKALIYRHFERKELLFQHVLVSAYRTMREAEARHVFSDDPMLALQELCEFTLRYYLQNPEFLVLVGIENLHKGENLSRVPHEELAISKLMEMVRNLLLKGEQRGVFRSGIDPVQLWLSLSGLCWFSVAAAFTVDITFDKNIFDDRIAKDRLATIKDVIGRYVSA